MSTPETSSGDATLESITSVVPDIKTETEFSFCSNADPSTISTDKTKDSYYSARNGIHSIESDNSNTNTYSSSSFESESDDDVVYSSSFVSSDSEIDNEDQAVVDYCRTKVNAVLSKLNVADRNAVLKMKKTRVVSKKEKQFCKRKIDGMQKSLYAAKKDVRIPERYDFQLDSQKLLPFPRRQIERMKTENVLHDMKEAAKTDFHYAKKCKQCKQKLEQFAMTSYAKQKISMLQKRQTEKNIEQYLYTMDSLTSIGNIVSELPRLQDNPDLIWQRLLHQETGPKS